MFPVVRVDSAPATPFVSCQPNADAVASAGCGTVVRPSAGAPGFEAGSRLVGFRLIRELGRGSFARVFLAELMARWLLHSGWEATTVHRDLDRDAAGAVRRQA